MNLCSGPWDSIRIDGASDVRAVVTSNSCHTVISACYRGVSSVSILPCVRQSHAKVRKDDTFRNNRFAGTSPWRRILFEIAGKTNGIDSIRTGRRRTRPKPVVPNRRQPNPASQTDPDAARAHPSEAHPTEPSIADSSRNRPKLSESKTKPFLTL